MLVRSPWTDLCMDLCVSCVTELRTSVFATSMIYLNLQHILKFLLFCYVPDNYLSVSLFLFLFGGGKVGGEGRTFRGRRAIFFSSFPSCASRFVTSDSTFTSWLLGAVNHILVQLFPFNISSGFFILIHS